MNITIIPASNQLLPSFISFLYTLKVYSSFLIIINSVLILSFHRFFVLLWQVNAMEEMTFKSSRDLSDDDSE